MNNNYEQQIYLALPQYIKNRCWYCLIVHHVTCTNFGVVEQTFAYSVVLKHEQTKTTVTGKFGKKRLVQCIMLASNNFTFG